MEGLLTSFQADLGSISSEILSLQQQSVEMNLRLVPFTYLRIGFVIYLTSKSDYQLSVFFCNENEIQCAAYTR
jgi:hypothetical protein